MQGKRRNPFSRKVQPPRPANEDIVSQAKHSTLPASTAPNIICAGVARQILRHFPDGWGAILDRRFLHLLAEGPGLIKLGLLPAQVVGKTVNEVLPPEIAEQVNPYFLRAFAGDEVSFELALGEQFFRVEASLLQETSNPAEAILVMAHHITSSKSLEAPFLVTRAEAQERESFISLVAHELRTPLTVISGHVQMLERGTLDEVKQAETLRKLREQTKRLQRLIDGLLDVSRIAAGRFEITPELTDLETLARSRIEEYQATTQRHTLILDAPSEPTVGRWDRQRLSQVLSHLLSNAIKYSPQGEIRVSIQHQEASVQVRVQDQGAGMAEAEIGQLFQLYSRLERTRKIVGNGLGLYLSKGYIEAHGGRIWATSPGLDQGSTFYFTLPCSSGT